MHTEARHGAIKRKAQRRLQSDILRRHERQLWGCQPTYAGHTKVVSSIMAFSFFSSKSSSTCIKRTTKLILGCVVKA